MSEDRAAIRAAAPILLGAAIMLSLAMVQGLAFSSYQVGSALGAFGGGYLFDLFGNYQLAMQIGIGMGLTAGVVQLLSAFPGSPGARPSPA